MIIKQYIIIIFLFHDILVNISKHTNNNNNVTIIFIIENHDFKFLQSHRLLSNPNLNIIYMSHSKLVNRSKTIYDTACWQV